MPQGTDGTVILFVGRRNAALADAWVRSLPPGTAVTVAYGSLMNHGNDTVTIINVTSTTGTEAQMHDVIADATSAK